MNKRPVVKEDEKHCCSGCGQRNPHIIPRVRWGNLVPSEGFPKQFSPGSSIIDIRDPKGMAYQAHFCALQLP